MGVYTRHFTHQYGLNTFMGHCARKAGRELTWEKSELDSRNPHGSTASYGTRQRGPGGRQADRPLKINYIYKRSFVVGWPCLRQVEGPHECHLPRYFVGNFFLDNSSLFLTFSKKSICEMVRVLLVLSQSLNY